VARRKQASQSLRHRFSKIRIILIGVFVSLVLGVGALTYRSLVPVNGSTSIFQAPVNHTIKATHSQSTGYHWLSVASSKVKGTRTSGGSVINPSYTFNKGELESLHVINGDYTTHSSHNFNIDEFNVHTKDLGYFQTESVMLLADKAGTFEYYCSIHPEMRGTVAVE
jgi:plastocyanin